MQDIRLVVNIDDEVIQTGFGGRKVVTEAMLAGGGGVSTVATVDNIVMKDTDGTLFFKRVTGTTPPVLTNWKLSDGTSYTITGSPVPYIVSTTNVEGSVEITNEVGTEINTKSIVWNGTDAVAIHQRNTQASATDYAFSTEAVLHGLSTAGGGTYVDVKVSPSGTLQIGGMLDVAYSIGNASSTTQRVVIANDQPAYTVNLGTLNGAATNAGITGASSKTLTDLNTVLANLLAAQTLTQTATQSVAVGAASVQSSVVGSTTTRVVLSTTGNCWVSIGSNPTAAAHGVNSFYLAAGASTYPMSVISSSSKIAVIQDGSATGYLSILESV